MNILLLYRMPQLYLVLTQTYPWMNDLLEERGKTINKILKYMTENNYLDEELYLSLKVQELAKNVSCDREFDLEQLKKGVKQSKEYEDLFENDNIVVQNVKTGDMCCLTQMKIRERWESACGHAMERNAVLGYMKKDKNARCPVIGCNMVLRERRGK